MKGCLILASTFFSSSVCVTWPAFNTLSFLRIFRAKYCGSVPVLLPAPEYDTSRTRPKDPEPRVTPRWKMSCESCFEAKCDRVSRTASDDSVSPPPYSSSVHCLRGPKMNAISFANNGRATLRKPLFALLSSLLTPNQMTSQNFFSFGCVNRQL